MFDWSKLLSLGFWFTVQPGPFLAAAAQFLLVLFGLCLVAAVVFFLISRAKKHDRVIWRLFKKLQSYFTTLGLIGFLILFFFYQQIPYLSSRFWLIVWLLIVLVWAGFIGKFGFIEVPRLRVERAEKEKIEKYLPKKKK
ncbi:MAG: hypothetical protein WCT37_00230 [Patescibacteria group bacterium]|jgi:amino acid transporter